MPATLVAGAQVVPALLQNEQTTLYQVYYQYVPNHLKENKCITTALDQTIVTF